VKVPVAGAPTVIQSTETEAASAVGSLKTGRIGPAGTVVVCVATSASST
jgi:hypothetical protein